MEHKVQLPDESIPLKRKGSHGVCLRILAIVSTSVILVAILSAITYLYMNQQQMLLEIQALQNQNQNQRLEMRQNSHFLGTLTRTKRDASESDDVGAHFEAFIDEERLARQKANDEETIGEFTDNGFRPNDQVYRIWKPSNWTNTRNFRYDENTGKVTVRQKGNYIIYSQILFHGPSARKSYGIHVNDETVPVVECISFDIINGVSKREKRDLSTLLRRNVNGATNDVIPETDEHQRTKRSNDYASYNQCNTMVVVKLNKNDKVFMKSLERGRTVIPQRSLTFWGVSKL